MAEVNNINERFEDAKELFATIKQECECEVVCWFWATSDLYSMVPYYYERYNYSKGKKLKQEPEKKTNKSLYGVNADGEIVVERTYTTLDDIYFYETFYKRTTNFVEKLHYHYYDKHLIRIEQFRLQNGKVVKQHDYNEKSDIVEDFEYQDNKLLRSHQTGHYDSVFTYEYDEIGELAKITWDDNVCYIKPDKKRNINQLITLSKERLYQLLSDYLKQLQLDEKIYAIALQYGNEDYFPPIVTIGTERQREGWISEKEKRAKDFIWLPGEYEFEYEFGNLPEETKNLFDLCNQETGMNSKDKLARKAIAEVAPQLNDEKDVFGFNTTDDFIIFATDYELADLTKNLKLIDPVFFGKVKKELP